MHAKTKLAQYSFISISFYSFILAFFPLYFQSIGFNASQLSIISAISTLATVLVPPLTMEIVHRYYSARTTATVLVLLTPISYIGLFIVPDNFVWTLIGVFFLVNAFKRSLDTLVETETIRRSAFGELYFEHVRVWGSIGFVVASLLVGVATDFYGPACIPICGLLVLLLLIGITRQTRPLLRSQPAKQVLISDQSRPPEVRSRAKFLTFAATLINWASHGPFYVYFSIYLAELGWSKTWISVAWAIGVIAEILFFIYFPKIERHFGLLRIFRFSLLITVLRWTLLALSQSATAILVSQLFHALSFTGVYLASIRLISELTPEDEQERSQGMLIAWGQGVGSLLGRLGAGFLAGSLLTYRELPQVFAVAAVFALLGAIFSFFIHTSDSHTSTTSHTRK